MKSVQKFGSLLLAALMFLVFDRPAAARRIIPLHRHRPMTHPLKAPRRKHQMMPR